MADLYVIEITPYAESIRQYITVNLQSPQNAISTLSAIRKEIRSLCFMPARIALTPDEPWGTEGIHRMQVKNFYVYFCYDWGGLELTLFSKKCDNQSKILKILRF